MSIPSIPALLAQDANIRVLWPVAAQSGLPLLPRLISWAESGGNVDEIAAIYSEARKAIGDTIADHDADPEYASAAGHEWGPDHDSSHADTTATAAALAAVAAAAWSAAACAAAEAAAAKERARLEAITSHPAYVEARAIQADVSKLPSRIHWRAESSVGYLEARHFVCLDVVRHVEAALDPSAPDGWGTYRDPSRAWIARHVAALRAFPGSTHPITGSEAKLAAACAAATEIADRLEALIAMLPPVSPEDARVSAVRRAIARETTTRPVAGPVAGPLHSALLTWAGDLAGIEQICASVDAAADAERLDADVDDECWTPFRDDLPAAIAAMIASQALIATRDNSSLDDQISPEAIASFVSLWGHPIGS